MAKKNKKPAKKCRQEGFIADCVSCGDFFVAGAHVTPKCGGGFGDHSKHHEDDCCGYGNHKERREGLICSDCIYRRNIDRLG